MEKLFEKNDSKNQINDKDLVKLTECKNESLKDILKEKFIEWSTSSTR